MTDGHSTSPDDTTAPKKVIPLKAGENIEIPLYVGIGASAGGLEAIQTFFQNMPPHSPLAFIVIQHLSPDYKSLMVELLSKKTRIPVRRAEDGMRVTANRIYLIPPKKNLKIFHGKLLLSDQDPGRGINLPIDIFLHSLAEDQGERAAAIILSGTGSDGMRGVRAVKEQGGLVMVQKESSAKFDGMPRAAISTGLADFILAPEEMPGQLDSYVKHPYVSKSDRAHRIQENETGLTRIFALLRERHKIDFTFYKPSTVTRRIERRMSVNQIVDINEYARYVGAHPAEVSILYRELLIGVTRFFRDPEAFDRLNDKWLPTLMENPDQHELRLWVPGCSTGEEAYSVAMSVRQCMERLGISKDVKIFATDLDRESISKAGAGIYPESIAADISSRMLAKYFYRKDENFHIVRSIREMVVFAQHNLIKDPPFTQIDLVTCRNLLIYLQPVLQRKVLNMINFSLRPGGILMLGLSETVGDLHEMFELVESKFKIYRSLGKANFALGGNGLKSGGGRLLVDHREQMLGDRRPFRRRAEDLTLQRFVDALSGDYIPLSIVVNEHLEVQHLVGDSSGLFRLPSGRPVNDISKMVAKELAIPLSTGIQKVYRSGKPHVFSNIRIEVGGRPQALKMTIRPLPAKRGQEALVAVIIEEMAPPRPLEEGADTRVYDLDKEAEQYLRDMEHELQFTRENLQATIEELETANEELQATNEELLASNEELQSTNEELQSTNEELHTVNVEYQNKIIELTELNNDVENLLANSHVGKLLLDDNLEIRRFSTRAREIFQILSSDIGRPLTHLTHRIVNADPLAEVQVVMESKKAVKKEIQTEDGTWYLMRISPYQIGPDIYAGAVLSFVDITELVGSRRQLEASSRKYAEAQEIACLGYWELDIVHDRLHWSDRVHAIFGVDRDDFDATYDGFLQRVHPDDREGLKRVYQTSLRDKTPYNIVHRIVRPDGGIRHVNEICRTEYDGEGRPLRSIGTVQDVTARRELEQRLSASEDRYRSLFDAISSGVAVYRAVDGGRDFTFRDFNRSAEEIEQIDKEALIGRRLTEIFPGAAASGLVEALREVWRTGEPKRLPSAFYKDKRISGWRQHKVYKLPTGDLVAVYDDLTAEKEAESTLLLAESEKTLILDNISEVILHLDLDRRIKWLNAAAAEALGEEPGSLIGRSCHTVWCGEAQDCGNCPFQQAVDDAAAAVGTLTDAGGRRWQVTANPLLNDAKELVGVVEVRRPID